MIPSVLLSVLLIAGCGEKEAGAGGPPAAAGGLAVSVMTVKTEPLTMVRELPGRVSAYKVAEVRARISGIVEKRLFDEGADVKEGEVLFQIDPAPYEAALESARANLARAEANLVTAQAQAERFEGLVGTNAISKQSYDESVGAALAGKADVAAAKAAVRLAEINVGYTEVTAPISGRIGRASVTEGAYVQQGVATLLATIQQLDPLYIDLNQSVEDVLKMKKALASGQLEQTSEGSVRLSVLLDSGEAYAHEGALAFTDVSVNPTTNMLTLRGTVPNPDLALLPGMFVRARMNEGINPEAILIPQSLVSRNTRGDAVVLVVGSEGTVENRVIETNQTEGNRWLVEKGLKVGDRLITDNLHKVRPGMPVTVVPDTTTVGLK